MGGSPGWRRDCDGAPDSESDEERVHEDAVQALMPQCEPRWRKVAVLPRGLAVTAIAPRLLQVGIVLKGS